MIGNGVEHLIYIILEWEIEIWDDKLHGMNNLLLIFKSGKVSKTVLGKIHVVYIKRRISNLEEKKAKKSHII